jgi:hypothetical protein
MPTEVPPVASTRPAGGLEQSDTRAVAGHRISTACHTFYGPPKPADQVVLALRGLSRRRFLSSHNTTQRTNTPSAPTPQTAVGKASKKK